MNRGPLPNKPAVILEERQTMIKLPQHYKLVQGKTGGTSNRWRNSQYHLRLRYLHSSKSDPIYQSFLPSDNADDVILICTGKFLSGTLYREDFCDTWPIYFPIRTSCSLWPTSSLRIFTNLPFRMRIRLTLDAKKDKKEWQLLLFL